MQSFSTDVSCRLLLPIIVRKITRCSWHYIIYTLRCDACINVFQLNLVNPMGKAFYADKRLRNPMGRPLMLSNDWETLWERLSMQIKD
jgi:hypothetical protein